MEEEWDVEEETTVIGCDHSGEGAWVKGSALGPLTGSLIQLGGCWSADATLKSGAGGAGLS